MSANKPVEQAQPTLIQNWSIWLQLLLPQHLLSALLFRLARCEIRLVKDSLIHLFLRFFNINLDNAEIQEPQAYTSLNAFFTRALKAEARPIARGPRQVLSPVDGIVSQAGLINQGQLLQAKGHDYKLLDLLGGDHKTAEIFDGGSFITTYLSPRHYHRVHMPLDATLESMRHIPGRLLSVNAAAVAGIRNLFARNERLVTLFRIQEGQMALIMVGAIFVGSMETVWAGTVTPASQRISQENYLQPSPIEITLHQGDEMGRFNLGSTVILLFPKDRCLFDPHIRAGTEVRMGQRIGGITVPV